VRPALPGVPNHAVAELETRYAAALRAASASRDGCATPQSRSPRKVPSYARARADAPRRNPEVCEKCAPTRARGVPQLLPLGGGLTHARPSNPEGRAGQRRQTAFSTPRRVSATMSSMSNGVTPAQIIAKWSRVELSKPAGRPKEIDQRVLANLLRLNLTRTGATAYLEERDP